VYTLALMACDVGVAAARHITGKQSQKSASSAFMEGGEMGTFVANDFCRQRLLSLAQQDTSPAKSPKSQHPSTFPL
jgi:hypothetical protein